MAKMTLEERMKYFEKLSEPRDFIPSLPIIVRLDGQNFSNFCADMEKPFSNNFRDLMTKTLFALMERTNAKFGYTQSDEINLILYSSTEDSHTYFHGRRDKIITSLSSFCSVFFKENLKTFFPGKQNEFPTFDCRAFVLPTPFEVCNYIRHREQNCEINSVSMLAYANIEPRSKLYYKSTPEIKEILLKEKEIDWNKYDHKFKYGVLMQRRKTKKKFSSEEINQLPEKHHARNNPELEFERTEIKTLPIKFESIKNKIDVIFNSVDPI